VSLIDSDYVDTIRPDDKMPGAFDALLKSLDKLSSYLDSEKTRIFNLFLQAKHPGSGFTG